MKETILSTSFRRSVAVAVAAAEFAAQILDDAGVSVRSQIRRWVATDEWDRKAAVAYVKQNDWIDDLLPVAASHLREHWSAAPLLPRVLEVDQLPNPEDVENPQVQELINLMRGWRLEWTQAVRGDWVELGQLFGCYATLCAARACLASTDPQLNELMASVDVATNTSGAVASCLSSLASSDLLMGRAPVSRLPAFEEVLLLADQDPSGSCQIPTQERLPLGWGAYPFGWGAFYPRRRM